MCRRKTPKLFLIAIALLTPSCQRDLQIRSTQQPLENKIPIKSSPSPVQTPPQEKKSSNTGANAEDARPFVELAERCKHAPVGKAKVTPLTGQAPLKVIFSDNGSYDPDKKKIVRWKWTFGNGQSKEGKTVTYVYEKPGEYGIGLNVSDSEGQKTSDCSDLNTGIIVVVTPGDNAADANRSEIY